MYENRLLECGHTQRVQEGRESVFCGLCGDVARVVVAEAAVAR